MKIVTPAAERKPFWLFAHDLTCPECETTFRVQSGDAFGRGKGADATLDCPYCRRPLFAWRPRAAGEPPRVTLA